MLDFGLNAAEFRDRYLEQQVYVHKAAMRERPLQWSDLDSLLYTLEPDESLLQLFNNGQLPPQSYIDTGFELGRSRRRLNKHRFYGLMRSGATAVLNRVEDHSLPAKRLCAEVGRFVGHQTTGNAYVSFGGNGSFGKHWDTHDVFAIQLIGKKRWQIFAPTFPLPLSNHTSEQLQQECPKASVLDCILEAGDLLYIPRGWWHQTLPFDAGSLHLSVGAYLPTVFDYVMWACSRHLPWHMNARKGLVNGSANLQELAEVMQTMTQTLLAQQQLDEFKQEIISRERLVGEFDLGLFLGTTNQGLMDHASVKFTSAYEPDHASGEVAVNGGRLRLENVSRAVVKVLAGTSELALSQLYKQLPQIPPQAICSAVLDLARYEVVSISR